MHNTLKPLILTALFAPLITHGMSQQNKIELGKRLVEATACADWDMVQGLIRAGADLNQKNGAGQTVLMLAIQISNAIYKQTLIDNPSVYSSYYESPLAQKAYWYLMNIPRMLIDADADLNLKSAQGRTALMVAEETASLTTCCMIVEAQFRQLARQKKCVYTTLNCLKRMPGGQYSNLRNIFKPILNSMIQEIRQQILNGINQLPDDVIKRRLLRLYNYYIPQTKNSRCTIL